MEKEKEHVKIGDFEGYQNSDYEFHDEIIRSSGSRVFQNVLLLMMEKTRIARVSSLAAGKRIVDSLEEHYAIYDALLAKDPEGSYEKMVCHIINAKESYIKTIIEKGIAYE